MLLCAITISYHTMGNLITECFKEQDTIAVAAKPRAPTKTTTNPTAKTTTTSSYESTISTCSTCGGTGWTSYTNMSGYGTQEDCYSCVFTY